MCFSCFRGPRVDGVHQAACFARSKLYGLARRATRLTDHGLRSHAALNSAIACSRLYAAAY